MKFHPKFVVWELTLACNANCKHCASNAGLKREGELDTSEAFNLIEQLENIGVESVFLSGGEPTLREDFYEIAEKITSSNMSYGFITNGLVKLEIDFFKKYRPFAVGVSIDGTEKTHNEVKRYLNAFKKT
ncbi:MAG: hypothetical protein BAJALOKI1v1_2370002 [Promethearchaeota archaeon]|nr:MAG: hypothetical protein BAJALOKI1v1_2370002 [Candidatus Lokiarchaeota archaeon]